MSRSSLVIKSDDGEHISGFDFTWDEINTLSAANMLLLSIQEFLQSPDLVKKMSERVNAKIEFNMNNGNDGSGFH
ncbi:hypothetical protein [Haliea sp.]|mgnify:CR=1|uniref:hypothetical protein n=1 Tax=Haliea sp. TaxID=1932666 RepID=UPI0025C33E83|nr:hypothetical protein [Haliea sp.]|tara:strand:+ start:3075 stop:3299 length:225 start_codon:yes stop_codon:yes gene_type:complete